MKRGNGIIDLQNKLELFLKKWNRDNKLGCERVNAGQHQDKRTGNQRAGADGKEFTEGKFVGFRN